MVCKKFSLLFLEHDHPVSLQITHVYLSAELDDVGMLLVHKPADVAEEKATLGVVRVGIRVRVAMMESVVATPDKHGIL